MSDENHKRNEALSYRTAEHIGADVVSARLTHNPFSPQRAAPARPTRGRDTSFWYALSTLLTSTLLAAMEFATTKGGMFQRWSGGSMSCSWPLAPMMITILGTFVTFGTMALRHLWLRRKTVEQRVGAFVLVGAIYATAATTAWHLMAEICPAISSSLGVEVLLTVCPIVILAIPAGWILVKHVKLRKVACVRFSHPSC